MIHMHTFILYIYYTSEISYQVSEAGSPGYEPRTSWGWHPNVSETGAAINWIIYPMTPVEPLEIPWVIG